MRVDQFDFDLPEERIALRPARPRDSARLLVVKPDEGLEEAIVHDLPDLLRPEDVLVINDTRVIPAKLVGYRQTTGGRWHGLFLESDEHNLWRILCKTRGKLQPGDEIVLQDLEMRDAFSLRMVAKMPGGEWIVQPQDQDEDVLPFDLLQRVGRVPLPHYIRHGQMVEADRQTYQTVYAKRPGSVAAPTAGLHLTDELLRQLGDRGLEICRVTLHVGMGTFRPIATATLDEHIMHTEWCEVSRDAARRIAERRESGGRVVAVGTTSVRVLESAAASKGVLSAWKGETDLFIRPPYRFKVVDSLMTNFHLPRSTLLVMVRTFGGDQLMRRAYQEAIEQEHRFFSYGDAMLIV